MATIHLNNIPAHLQGELYQTLTTEFTDDDTPLSQRIIIGNIRPLKLDIKCRGLKDIIQLIDTCMFFAAPLHWKIFEFVEEYSENIIREMREFEKMIENPQKEITSTVPISYNYIVETEEYRALKLLATYKRTWTWSVCRFLEYAIKNGSLVLIEHYAGKYSASCCVLPLKWAAEYGQIPILSFLVQQPWIKPILQSNNYNYRWSEQNIAQELCSHATAKNQLPVLKYLRETLGFDWDKYVVQFSICQDRLHILKYALENGCLIPEYGMTMAIGMESTEALRMLVDIGKMPLDKADYTLYAAQKGNLEHLQYLHEKNTPWHMQAVNMAARNKHFDCVDFGISVGAPYDTNIVVLAQGPFNVENDRWIGLQIYNATHHTV